jgi:hypothetical protein
MARIDRLEEKIREVLLGASVVGREFSRSVLEHVIKKKEEVLPSLRHLKGLEMVLEKEEAQELEYLFKHYLIQEVAYNTILIKKRKELHRLIAQAMEEVYADRLKELYELVAFHYEKAEDWEKAAEYLSRAGRKVRELYTSEESVDFHDRKATSLDELYQTGATKKSLAFKFFIAIVFVFFTVGGSITIFGAGKILRNIIPAFTGSDLPDALLIIVWGITVILIVYAWLMYLFYFILPAFQRTQNIDLVQNGIQVVWGRNRSFSLPYSDFDSIDFRGKARVKSRPWWHNLFDFSARIERFDAPSIRDLLFHELMGNFRVFYFGQETRYNKIFIRRKGERYKGILLLSRRFSPERFPLICLCPSDPEEFHNQLVIVFKKWKREQETGELLL